ncbi:hypothetical protein ACL2XP_27475 [Sodalis sp. RH21]|uniref:hypothetical protein n=1 Tax=unclassified Sodalis (in: enterobacteria) TaxID=2636512 RepID=UPI0039B4B5DA
MTRQIQIHYPIGRGAMRHDGSPTHSTAPRSAYAAAHTRPKRYRVEEKNGLAAYADKTLKKRVGVLPYDARISWSANKNQFSITRRGRLYGCVTLMDDIKGSDAMVRGRSVWVLADRNNLKQEDAKLEQPPAG